MTTDRAPQAAPDGAGDERALLTLWCQAIDAARSDDFRDSYGMLNEKAYLAYQRRAISQCLATLARSRPASPAPGANWSHHCPVRKTEWYTPDDTCVHCGATRPKA